MLWALLAFLLICLLYLFLIKPNGRRAEAAIFANYKYAHRGLYDNDNGIPENSLAAFRRAKNSGFGVELDVQLTSDKVPVVFHDENLKRMCGDSRNVRELTFEQLRELKLLCTDERIPLFTDVLDLLGDTPIVCEIKTYPTNDLSVCKIASDNISSYNSKLCVESFNPLAVRYFRINFPSVVRGQLSKNFNTTEIGKFTGFVLKNLLMNFLAKLDFIAFRHTDFKCFSFSLCRKLFRPFNFAWTVSSLEDEKNALSAFDTIIFEKYIPERNDTD